MNRSQGVFIVATGELNIRTTCHYFYSKQQGKRDAKGLWKNIYKLVVLRSVLKCCGFRY